MDSVRSAAALTLLAALLAANIALDRGEPLIGDEARYKSYAENLLAGGYAQPETGLIENGPGYPLYLAPFLAAGLDGPALRFTQIPLVLIALAYLFALVARLSDRRTAAWAAAALASYPPLWLLSGDLLSEPLAIALWLGFAFHFLRWQSGSAAAARDPWLAAALLGGFVLTKVAYGYVVLAVLVLLVMARAVPAIRQAVAEAHAPEWVFAGALAVCAPYLAYTYQLTDQLFYWGTNGGDVLYWMTVDGPGLSGTWLPIETVREHEDLRRDHLTFLEAMAALPAIEADRRFKARVVENLRTNPTAYAKNWVGNVSRLLFNYPWSRRGQSIRTLGYVLPNAALLMAFGASFVAAWRNRSSVPAGLLVLLGMFALGTASHSLMSSTGRLFVVCVPFLILWVAFTAHHFVRVEIRRGLPS